MCMKVISAVVSWVCENFLVGAFNLHLKTSSNMAYMSAKAMDFSLPEAGLPLDTLVADCRAALRYQVKTGHPHFFNQLSQVIVVY